MSAVTSDRRAGGTLTLTILLCAALLVIATILRLVISRTPALHSSSTLSAAAVVARSAMSASVSAAASPTPRIALISFYGASSLPWYANYWLTSCGAQRVGVDCILVLITGATDRPGVAFKFAPHAAPASIFACRNSSDPLPPNLIVLEISPSDFHEHFAATTGFRLHERPEELDFRKLADFKPLYGALLGAWLDKYSHWGWMDIDLILGDVLGLSVGTDPDADLHMWYHDGGWTPPHVSGQLSVVRNSGALKDLWRRHGPALVGIMRDPDYREFDERAFGAVVFGVDGPNATTPSVLDDDTGELRPLRVRAVALGAFSDMPAVCNDDARGWRFWWGAGNVWGEHCHGYPTPGAYFHFMCAKWSHAFWKPHGRVCDAHQHSRWGDARWNITFTADPTSINCGDACRSANLSKGPLRRSRLLGSLWQPSPRAEIHSGLPSSPVLASERTPSSEIQWQVLPSRRRLFKAIADDALLTFHDPSWGVRPQRADAECGATSASVGSVTQKPAG